jgi:exosortase/archaeosortase family protein
LFNKRILIYLAKFAGAFCILYFGTLAVIGLSAPVGFYSSFVDKYLNFIPAFRYSLLNASKYFLEWLGYDSFISSPIKLSITGGGGAVRIVYSCLGYGVTSFWLAFVFANNGSWKRKLAWMLGGTALLYIINVVRISLTLLSNSKKWHFPFGWDNHTWFNIAAYGGIFLLIWFYDQKSKEQNKQTKKQKSIS